MSWNEHRAGKAAEAGRRAFGLDGVLFFQAEDGIRDLTVTGVQTCALPIWLERALLNLGHTFGHALESATAYKEWLHGEAVGAGLSMAAAMSRECGLMTGDEAARVRALLERAGLPTRIAAVTPAAVREHMGVDKKGLGGRLRLVLLRGIGDAFLTADYPAPALARSEEHT